MPFPAVLFTHPAAKATSWKSILNPSPVHSPPQPDVLQISIYKTILNPSLTPATSYQTPAIASPTPTLGLPAYALAPTWQPSIGP